MIELFGTQIALDYKLAFLMVSVLLGGIVRGFTGFGSALIIMPALTILFGPRQAIAIEALIEIPVALALLPSAVRHADRRVVTPMCLVLVLAIPFGALALIHIAPNLMKIGISLAVLVMAALLAFQNEFKSLIGRRGTIAAGFVSGLIQGATGVGGPPGVIALLARADNPQVSRGNVIAFMNCMVTLTALSVWAYGFVSREVIVLSMMACPVLLLSVMAGSFAFKRWGDKMLRTVALIFVALSALATLISALPGVF
ncbi:MAG: sulfite exporter TauE/SafE family protein [Burkholderiaceae bacterium]